MSARCDLPGGDARALEGLVSQDGRELSEQLEAAKRGSVAQLLFKCARLWNDQAIARMRAETGMDGLRPAHMSLFPHIDLEGTRLTVLAERLGISKQAVAQLVDDLVAMGGLERVRDPSDGRAKLIRFRDGGQGLLEGLHMLKVMEGEMAEELGEASMRDLHRILLRLHDLLESEGVVTDRAD